MAKKDMIGEPWYSRLFALAHARCDVRDKLARTSETIDYMIDRTSHIIEYEGFPETVDAHRLEVYRQLFGFSGLAKLPKASRKLDDWKETPYALTGSLGGELDEYWIPTEFIVNVPYFGFSGRYRVGKDCVIMRSDTAFRGFLPIFRKYATLINESEITMLLHSINARALAFMTAADGRDKESAEKVLDDLEAGKLGVAISQNFLEGIKTSPFGAQTVNALTQQIELNQYLYSRMFAEIGLPMNGNMKREALNSAEVGADDLSLLPLIDDYIYWTDRGVKEYNEMFDADVKWRLSGAWRDVVQDIDNEIQSAEEAAARNGTGDPETERETEIPGEPETEASEGDPADGEEKEEKE